MRADPHPHVDQYAYYCQKNGRSPSHHCAELSSAAGEFLRILIFGASDDQLPAHHIHAASKGELNERAHRVCELNQDAFIFQRLKIGPVGAAEYLKSGIWRCCDKPQSGILDPAVATVWDAMFEACYPNVYHVAKPRINEWHRAFKNVVNIAEESAALPAFARHLGVNAGWTYPAAAEIDMQYIEALDTPAGKMHYQQVFEKAMANVLELWSVVAAAVFEGDMAYQKQIGDWDLDTGEDAAKNLVLWRAQP